MMFIAPFFSSQMIPQRIKVMLAFWISLVIYPTVASLNINIPNNMGLYGLLVVNEVAIGIYIGFLVAMIFTAFQLSGQYFAVQMGFGFTEVLDPLAQVSVPLIGQLKNFMGLLVFLVINGHHLLIQAVYRSYELAPLIGLDKGSTGGLLKFLLISFTDMFVIALKIALPIIGVIFLISVSMGVLAKAAPQMNIMMLGFPFKIIMAFALLILMTPLIIRIMNVSLDRTFQFISKVLHNWPG